jgi:hypothetical protein
VRTRPAHAALAVALAAALGGCSGASSEATRPYAWLELAGDPDASPAELSRLLYASLAPETQAGLDRLAASASQALGPPLTGADMLRFEGLAPGVRVRTLEVTAEGKLRVVLDRIPTGAPGGPPALLPEPIVLDRSEGTAEAPGGLLLPGLIAPAGGGS